MALPTTLDLRDCPEENLREQLFGAIEECEGGDGIDIVAARDVDPALVRYQVEHDRAMDWEDADPDAEPRELHLTVGDPLDTDQRAAIDVRDPKPQRRHESPEKVCSSGQRISNVSTGSSTIDV